jgi:hypothetical protein
MSTRLGVLASTIVLVAGCGSLYQNKVSSPPASTSTSTPAPAPLAASDAIKNGQMTLAVGQRLTVTLHSTYWQFGASSDPSVVATQGSPKSQICANPPGFPGSGCGTVVEQFAAVHAGSAVLTASRNSCGEALRCSPDQSSWRLTVTVP